LINKYALILLFKAEINVMISQPIENYSEWRLLYFISFLLLVGFFVLNMFVGVVVENFHRCREEQEKEEKARRAVKRAKQMEKKRRSACFFFHFG
jgi:voltage-dependent calcium channel T type alpha-1G